MKPSFRFTILLPLLFTALTSGAAPTKDFRAKIGSVFNPPVEFGGKYYLVSSSGVLIETDLEQKNTRPLFEGKLQTMGALVLSGDRLYWGDGLHSNSQSFLHVYDLKQKKMVQSFSIQGHIERPVRVLNGKIFVPQGMGGLVAYDSQTLKTLWMASAHDGKRIHVDSNLVDYKNEICGTTVYDVKGVICFDQGTGKETRFTRLKKDPKSEIVLSGDSIYGFATEADLVNARFDIPADLYGFDLSKGKLKFEKELRGFNFFAPTLVNNELFVTLSTGDFILVNPETQKITFLGEFSEPFINNALFLNGDYCGIGIMGKFNCYTKTKGGAPAISKDRRIMGPVLGRISVMNSKLIVPTRIGYSIE